MDNEFWEPSLWGQQLWTINTCLLPFSWQLLGEIYSNKPRRDPSLLQGLKGLTFDSSTPWVFRQDRRAAAVLRSFPQLCCLTPQGGKDNSVVNRPFLRSGSPERREGLFVVGSSQHKRRAVLGLKARLRSAKRCQGLRAAPSALCTSYCILPAFYYIKIPTQPWWWRGQGRVTRLRWLPSSPCGPPFRAWVQKGPRKWDPSAGSWQGSQHSMVPTPF